MPGGTFWNFAKQDFRAKYGPQNRKCLIQQLFKKTNGDLSNSKRPFFFSLTVNWWSMKRVCIITTQIDAPICHTKSCINLCRGLSKWFIMQLNWMKQFLLLEEFPLPGLISLWVVTMKVSRIMEKNLIVRSSDGFSLYKYLGRTSLYIFLDVIICRYKHRSSMASAEYGLSNIVVWNI